MSDDSRLRLPPNFVAVRYPLKMVRSSLTTRRTQKRHPKCQNFAIRIFLKYIFVSVNKFIPESFKNSSRSILVKDNRTSCFQIKKIRNQINLNSTGSFVMEFVLNPSYRRKVTIAHPFLSNRSLSTPEFCFHSRHF